jgi:hypothetical protein
MADDQSSCLETGLAVPVDLDCHRRDGKWLNDRYPCPGRGAACRRGAGAALFVTTPIPDYPPIFTIDHSNAAFKTALIADLRLARAAYPRDEHLAELVRAATRSNEQFRQLWATATHGSRMGGRKHLQHAQEGDIDLDCDVLKVPGDDLRIMTYTATEGTSDAKKLEALSATASRAADSPSTR